MKGFFAGFRPRRRLLADKRGTSAVEFALILPVMAMLYFGGYETMQGIGINRMVALTCDSVTNLVSQYTTISASSQMPDIFAAGSQILAPYTKTPAKVVISLITVDATGKIATVTWSQGNSGAVARTKGQVVTIPAAFMTANASVLLGETTYPYTPVFDFLHFGTITLSSSVYILPRASTTINLAA